MAAPTTYVYKRAGGCDIKADVYMPAGAPTGVPVLLCVPPAPHAGLFTSTRS